jgi:hypothetical protein
VAVLGRDDAAGQTTDRDRRCMNRGQSPAQPLREWETDRPVPFSSDGHRRLTETWTKAQGQASRVSDVECVEDGGEPGVKPVSGSSELIPGLLLDVLAEVSGPLHRGAGAGEV